MAANVRDRLKEFYQTISEDLDRTIQFWLDHSIDEQEGGFYQCLETDGTVYDTNKYTWLLCRQVWVFARLYRTVKRFHQPHILQTAQRGIEFILQHVKNPTTSRCYISLTRDGKPIKMQRTIFSEVFYIMATSEMYAVTSQDKYKDEALSVMKKVIHWVREDNSDLGLSVPPPSATSSLAVPMVLLMLVAQLESTVPQQDGDYYFTGVTKWCTEQVSKHVVQRRDGEDAVVLETVGEQGEELTGSGGRLVNPGHAIEAGWFLLERAEKHGQDDKLTAEALDVFIWKSFQLGWDTQHGGLLYFVDVDGRPPTQLEWDMKLWWPHSEAMIAFLKAYKHTKDEKYLEKFAQVFDYSYKHFVDKNHGEWFGYLSREGKVKIHAKGGQWKGCFHVPRALMMCEQMLEELLK